MGSEPPKDADTPWTKDTAKTFENKAHSKYFDPCQDAASKSIKCLHRNGGDKTMCQDYFQAYRDCKKEWTAQRKAERASRGSGWF
ncbi:hypothetical protein EJ08DRAFT_693119 [Tothia fuscella]|uniref:Uncharacterized protein n=1 Tax=Tothia fuscella TaxID=1048955 RepID=A0A9P4P239_9PEZI|nr:hypothetical protein EJ08DRAFT_693119 [Tothia fuscella]